MEINKKCVFAGFGIPFSSMRKFQHILSESLQEKVEISMNRISCFLYVPTSFYEDALVLGSEIAIKMNLPIKWVNYYNHYIPLHYVSLMYGFLSEHKKDMVFDNFASSDPNHPYDIIKYVTELQNYLDNKNILIEYRPVSNAVELLVEGSFLDQSCLLEKCKTFDHNFVNSPFVQTLFTDISGRLTHTTSYGEESKSYQRK